MSWDVRFYWERFSSSDFIEIFAKILGRYPDKKYNVWDLESFYSVQIRMAYKTTITVLWKYLEMSLWHARVLFIEFQPTLCVRSVGVVAELRVLSAVL